MNNNIGLLIIITIDQIKEELSQSGFSPLETYKLAVQIQRNEILEYYFKTTPETELGLFD